MKVSPKKSIFLADDDADDCLLFEDALREISDETELTMANDGMELMEILERKVPPSPDVIFLDLNMPRKNGFECLREIRTINKLKHIPIVIFSTSGQEDTIRSMYDEGANVYIRKPGSFSKLKIAIKHILDMDWSKHAKGSVRDNFYFQV